MANPYYTPSPMVNFQYESKPSEAQGVLDTMKKIKKEGIEDETRQMKMLEAQQAYEMGNLKMQGAQMEMDKVKRREQIEQQSSQIYNAQLASGVPRSQAMKAVTDYRQANLDWSERQADLETMKKSSLEALKFADRVPPEALADAAAQFSISFGVEVTPEQFQQMSKNRQPVTTKDGRIYEWDNAQGDYVEKTPAALAKRLDEDRKFEQEIKRGELDVRQERAAAALENASLRSHIAAMNADYKMQELDRKIAWDQTRGQQGDRKLDIMDKSIDAKISMQKKDIDARLQIVQDKIKSAEKIAGNTQEGRNQLFALKQEEFRYKQESEALEFEQKQLVDNRKHEVDLRKLQQADTKLQQTDNMNTSSDKLTGMDKVNFDEAKIKLRTAGRELESARKALASGKEDQMAQLIARLGGASTGGLEGNKQALKDLIEQRENDMKRVLLLAEQSGVPAIQELVKWHDEFSSTPMTDARVDPSTGTSVKSAGKFGQYKKVK